MKTIFKLLLTSIFIFLISSTVKSQTEAGPNQEVCINQAELAADPPPDGFTGSWSVMSGFCTFNDLTAFNTGVTGLLENDNVLRWTVTNGIDITYYDDVTITNNHPTQAVTADDEEICQNTHTITANIVDIDETGTWTVINGTGYFSDSNDNVSDVSNISLGINTYRWTINKGICNSDNEIILTNNEISAEAGTDTTICEDFYDLSADDPSPGTGYWTIVSSGMSPTIDNTNNHNALISGLGSGTNSLKWTVTRAGCTTYDIIVITNDKATVTDAEVDRIACEDHIFLSANNPVVGTGEWSIVSSTGNIDNINDFYTEVTNLNVGDNEFKWTITNNECSSDDNVIINYDYFTADAGENAVICGDTFPLTGNDPSPGYGVWRTTGGTGTFINASTQNTDVSGMITGDNTFEWKITRGACVQVDYVTITKNTPSDADAGPNRESCGEDVLLAAVNPDIGTGSWSVFSGSGTFSNSLLNNTTVSNIGLGSNTYRWTVIYNGCQNYDDMIVVNNYVFADAGPDQVICGTSSSLDANEALNGETAYWELMAGTSTITDLNQFNTSVTNLNEGINRYRWNMTKGNCEDYDEIEIINNEYEVHASISDPAELCDDIATIQGNFPPSGGSGFWTVESGTGIFDNSTLEYTVVRNISSGSNYIRWNIEKDGCINYDVIEVVRNSVFADAGEDVNTCGTTGTVEANIILGVDNGIWTKVSGSGSVIDPTNIATDVIGLTNGINTFRWTVSDYGCEDFDDVIVTNYEFSTSAGINKQLCQDYTNLTAADPSPGYGYWEVVSGGGILVTPSNYSTDLTDIPDLSSNTYRWHAFINGCYAFDDITVESNVIVAIAGEDNIVCTNSANLAAKDAAPGTGVWTIQQGGGTISAINEPSTTVTGLSFNTNILRWTVSNVTCVDFDEITITNNSVYATAGIDQELCRDYVTLTGEEPIGTETGLWEVVSGSGDIQNPNLFNTQVTNLGSGYNTFKWTLFYEGCDSGGDDVTINNRGFNADAGPDQNLDDFVTSTFMNASLPPGGTGEWIHLSGSGNISTITDPSTQIVNMQTGINTFQWTVDYNGCTAYDLVYLTVLNFEPYAGNDKIICTDSIRLNARDDSGTPQVWTIIQGGGDFDNINNNDTWVKNIPVGINIYRWSVTLNSVTAYDEVIVTRYDSYAGEDQILCQNTYEMNASPVVTGSLGSWSIVSGSANIVTPSAYDTQITDLSNQNNTFRWTVNAGSCTVFDYVSILNDQIFADAGNDQSHTVDYAFLYANNPFDALTKGWTIISGGGIFENSLEPDTRINDLEPGDNILRWTITNNNCSDYDDVLIFYDYEEPPVNINVLVNKVDIYPNPNNGQFYISKTYSGKYDFEIYDQFGKLLFKEININSDKNFVDISAYASGIYFLKLKAENSKLTYKVVKK